MLCGRLVRFCLISLVCIFATAIVIENALASNQVLPYKEVMKDHYNWLSQVPSDTRIIVQGKDYVDAAGMPETGEDYEANVTYVVSGLDGDWLEWEFSIPVSGYYTIGFKYRSGELYGSYGPLGAMRMISIDDQIPFSEMKEVLFGRQWEPDRDFLEILQQLALDGERMEIAFRDLVEVREWTMKELADGKSGETYLFYLEEGEHRLRMASIAPTLTGLRFAHIGYILADVDESLEIAEIEIKTLEAIPPYEDFLNTCQERNVQPGKGISIKIQVEDYKAQGDEFFPLYVASQIRAGALFMRENAEPVELYNALGTWWDAGQWFTWEFDVPENGLYHITFRYSRAEKWQTFGESGPAVPGPGSARDLRLDGKYPFEEMKCIYFPSTGGIDDLTWETVAEQLFVRGEGTVCQWELLTLATPQQEPYLFFLEKGKHTLTMQALDPPMLMLVRDIISDIAGELTKVFASAKSVVEPSKELIQIDLKSEFPEMSEWLGRCISLFDDVTKVLIQFGGGREPEGVIGRIKAFKEEIAALSENPNLLLKEENFDSTSPYYFPNRIITPITNLVLEFQPVDLDFIVVHSPDVEVTNPKLPPFYAIRREWKRFIDSFKED
jgi:hypothetical protein